MFHSCFVSAQRRNGFSRPGFSSIGKRNGLRLAGASALALCLLGGAPLGAQTAHYGTTVTLGSGFKTPTGVTVDGYGNVFVADNGNSAVKEIVAVNGSIPASPTINTLGSGFANPFTVAVDASGNVYVADYGNHAVKEIEAVNGSIPASPTIRTLASGLSFIFGTAVDAKGDVFYSEYGKDLVKEILAVNGVIPAAPKTLVLGGGFNIPAGLAVDSSGNVFVGDQNNNVVKEILASSGYTTTNTIATGFTTPDGVALDQSGNVYVADDGNNLVKEVVGVNGVIPASPTIIPLGSGFAQTFDVAADLKGNVYVADRGNNAVKEIQRAAVNFGGVNVGFSSSTPMTLSFTFDTAGTLGSTAVVTQGLSGLEFVDAGGGTCVANTAYTASQVCTVNVTFAPLAPGPRFGAVELLSGTGALLATGYVQGTGLGPQATFAEMESGLTLPATTFSLGSGFNSPVGVAMDANQNLYVADSNNNAVKQVLAAGGWTSVKTLGSGFNSPSAVALDGSGNVFVADTFNDAVKEIVAEGGYATINTLGSGFSDPFAVAVDGNGNVFVADFSNNAVKEMLAVNGVVPASPNIRTLASGLSGPDGVAVDGSGNVFVANYFSGTVQEIVGVNGAIPDLPTIKTIGPTFNGPSNLSVDASGNVFVADTDDALVQEILAAGGYTTVRTLGSGFSAPEGVAVSGRGDVIVSDSINNVVDFLDYADTPSLSFATTQAGQTSTDSPQTVAVINDGNVSLTFLALSYPTDFPEAAGVSTDCKGATLLAMGATCTLSIDFSPKASSVSGTSTPLSELVSLKTNSLNLSSSQAVQVLGTATPGAPAVMLSPTSLSFPSTGVGFTSTLPVTVTNTGFGNLNVTGISNSGANPAYFTHTSNCGGTPIAPGAHCTLQVSFTPTAAGTFSAQLNITDNAAGSPHSFTVSGTAVNAPAVSLSTMSLSFPLTAVGSTSTLPVTVTNTGQANLTISGIAGGGTNPSDFGHTSNCGGHSIAPGGNCTVQVTFTPASAASFSATLVLTDNAPGSPRTITLSGTGH